jgi:activating signal cointegrator 1
MGAMKALSLTQPWASLIVTGAKQIETRSWFTSYRGQLLIHAAKGFPRWAKETADEEDFRNGLNGLTWQQLPTSAILCRVELMACVKTTEVDKLRTAGIVPQIQELKFGDYAEGRWAWGLRLIEVFAEPIPAKGALGLWEFNRN